MNHAWLMTANVAGVIVGLSGACELGLRVTPAAAAPPVKEDSLLGVTQNWDKNLLNTSRFTVLSAFGGTVRNNNTGLVWEQVPDATTRNWAPAVFFVSTRMSGVRVGWRLPSVAELNSVRDPSLPAPNVPARVFTGVQSTFYWSAASIPRSPGTAWVVDFTNGIVSRGDKISNTFGRLAWVCAVRCKNLRIEDSVIGII